MKPTSFSQLLAATMIFGCSFGCILEGGYRDAESDLVVGCSSNASCPSNALCTLGACLGTALPQETFRLRLSTTSASPVRDLDISDIEFDALAFLELNAIIVPSPLKTTGAVRLANGSRIEADVIAKVANDSGTEQRFEAVRYFQGDQPNFVLYLPKVSQTVSGSTRPLSFDLHVMPIQESSVPPLLLRGVSSDSITPPYFISLPADSDRFNVSGRVVFTQADGLPVSGLTALILNENEQRISTIATTTVRGEFSLALWSQSLPDSATLVVQDPNRRLPKLRQPISVGDGQRSIQLPVIDLGVEASIIHVSGTVIGEGPMPDATVSMVGILGDGLLAPAVPTTKANGGFHTQLLPAEYLIQVVPPISSPFGMYRLRSFVNRDTVLALRPPLKGSFKGVIVDSDGDPIANAAIEADLVEANFGDIALLRSALSTPRRVSHATSDELGLFELPLEPGTYTLRFRLPLESGLPNFSRTIEQPLNIGPLQPLEFVAPLSAVMIAQFNDPFGTPLDNELIQLWAQSTETLLASGRTNENGTVLLRVPLDGENP